MREFVGCEIGLSDHTHGTGAAIATVALRATVIEKHFTLSRSDGGAAFSLEPPELKQLIVESNRVYQALGAVLYCPMGSEENAVMRRRSLYIAKDMQAGDVLTSENLRRVRLGHGLPPRYYETLLGRRITLDFDKGTPLTWELVGE